jgi:Domain of unknown function (DUF4476)
MKKIFTLLVTSVFTLTLFAANRPSQLSVTLPGNSNIRVVIDNSRYENSDNSITIGDLSNGYHSIKVYEVKNQSRFFNNSKLVYSSSVLIKPAYQVNIMINRNGKAIINEQRLFDDRKYNDRDHDDRVERNNDYPYKDRNDNRYERDDNNRGGCQMSSERFSKAMFILERENFDNTRFTIAKEIVEDNYLSAGQVKQMLQLFSFDVNKLELAKYAYSKTIDKNNYFMLYDVIALNSYKERLAEFIRNNR